MKRIIIVVLLVNILKSQDIKILSIEDCLNYAYHHNLSLKNLNYNIDKSKNSIKQSYYDFLPSINTDANHYFNSGRSLNQESYNWENNTIRQGNMAIGIDLTIFQGFYRIYNYKYEKSIKSMNLYSLEYEKMLLSIKIIQSYYNIILIRNNKKELKFSNNNTKEELKKSQEQIKEGISAKSNIYELLAQDKKELSIIEEYNLKIFNEYNNLKGLMNWEEETELSINFIKYKGNLNDKISLDSIVDNIVSKSVINYQKDYAIDIIKYNIGRERSKLYPTFKINSSLSSRYTSNAINPNIANNLDAGKYTTLNQIEDNVYFQIGFSLNIPIFNKLSNRTIIKSLKIDILKSSNEKKIALQKLRRDLDEIKQSLTSTKKRIKIINDMVNFYKKNYAFSIDKFNSGLLNSYELNLSKNNYLKSKIEQNKLNIGYKMNLKLLEIYNNFSQD